MDSIMFVYWHMSRYPFDMDWCFHLLVFKLRAYYMGCYDKVPQ